MRSRRYMSRCFPYPPPGYTLSRSSEDALIESIKLQKERVKAKEQRKERRKEKKERRKEDDKRKERKEKANPNQNSDKYDISKGQCEKNFWASINHLEKSDLTDECEQPICLRIPSTSSTARKIAPKGRENSSPLIAGMAMKCSTWPGRENDQTKKRSKLLSEI